jgi:transposase
MLAKLRNICKSEMDKIKESLVFGQNVECSANVEIDESYFGKKRKYNRGKVHKKQWVFGITERQTNKVLLQLVSDRKKETLLPIITKHVSKTATIHHDDWSSYRKLSQLGYKDLVVNHSKHFKGPNGACTNTIEGLWGVIKQRITRMHGIEMSKLDAYLSEFSFRYYYKHDILEALLKGIWCV